MSNPIIKWVITVKTGNQTAKQLLLLYSCLHTFNASFDFTNDDLADYLEVSSRAIQKANKLLIEKKLLIKRERFDENGAQLCNTISLNLPKHLLKRNQS